MAKVSYLDKSLRKMTKKIYSLDSVIKFFDIYGEEYYKANLWNDSKKLEAYYHIWMISRAGYRAGIQSTIAFMNGGELPDDFKTL